MEDLLKRFVGGERSGRTQAPLLREHRRHFQRRVRPLDSSFFPGRERSDEAIESLANGAFASFDKEPTHEGRPAFKYAVDKGFSPPTGFLYYWRASATILFLRREGPDVLRARANIQRNVRLHVQDACEQVRRGVETRWALPAWSEAQRAAPPPPIDQISVDLGTAGRGKSLVEAVLKAAGAPLTRAEISAVIERSSGFLEEVADPTGLMWAVDAVSESVEREITRAQLGESVRRFVASLSDEERQLLIDRGYASSGRKRTSFRAVAELRGKSPETYRKMEKRIVEAVGSTFEPEEMVEVTSLIVEALAQGRDR